MKKENTKKLLIVLSVLLVIAIILKYKYSLNNNYIKKYNNQEYDINIPKKLLFLNFQEKYIAHYNYGTALYQTEQYNEARDEFNEALKTVPDNRICDVRVNIALTEIKLLPKTNDKDEYDNNIQNIQNILLENDCATKDHNGKDKKAQDLYDLLEKAKDESNTNQEEADNNDSQDEDNNDTETQKIENEKDKIEQVKNKNREASKERSSANDREHLNFDYKKPVW
jgi:tetratricopeptide (TPR) repeat protein